MPLPKPPAKRASLLSAADFDSQAAPQPRQRSEKSRTAAEPASPAVLDLFDGAPQAVSAALPKAAAPVAAAPRRHAQPEPRVRKPRGTGPTTLFVLDTNVLMHDPTSLFRFDEHDIYLPMITLEELDGHKRGMTEVARNARQVSRDLDALAASMPSRDSSGMSEGLPLARTGHTRPPASCSSRPT